MGADPRRWREYDPEQPWQVGNRLVFSTGDDEDADTRELDGTWAGVLDVSDPNWIRVDSIYGERGIDPYQLIARVPSTNTTRGGKP